MEQRKLFIRGLHNGSNKISYFYYSGHQNIPEEPGLDIYYCSNCKTTVCDKSIKEYLLLFADIN